MYDEPYAILIESLNCTEFIKYTAKYTVQLESTVKFTFLSLNATLMSCMLQYNPILYQPSCFVKSTIVCTDHYSLYSAI